MYSTRKTRIHGVEWVEVLEHGIVIAEFPSEYGANARISHLKRLQARAMLMKPVKSNTINYAEFNQGA